MRIWASCNTLTCDEVLLIDRRQLPLRFALSHQYIHHWSPRHPHGLYLEPNSREFVPIVELGRNVYLMNGFLHRTDMGYQFKSEIEFNLYNLHHERWLNELVEKYPEDRMTCLGRISVYGSDFKPESSAYEVIVHRFETLDLVHDSLTFGQWVAFDSYSKYISDPDVIGADVLLAEIEVLKQVEAPQ